jgi:chromosomal replication initiation ATPase DnaA
MSLDTLLVIVSEAFGLSKGQLTGPKRDRQIVEARVAFTMTAKADRWTQEAISQALNRDHSTIIHYVKMYNNTRCLDHIKPTVEHITSKLK